jgi:hypothetical protein
LISAPTTDHHALLRAGELERQRAAELAAGELATASFTPLQVLGVPGWWPGQDAAFYLDTSVFRPKRQPAADNVTKNC